MTDNQIVNKIEDYDMHMRQLIQAVDQNDEWLIFTNPIMFGWHLIEPGIPFRLYNDIIECVLLSGGRPTKLNSDQLQRVHQNSAVSGRVFSKTEITAIDCLFKWIEFNSMEHMQKLLSLPLPQITTPTQLLYRAVVLSLDQIKKLSNDKKIRLRRTRPFESWSKSKHEARKLIESGNHGVVTSFIPEPSDILLDITRLASFLGIPAESLPYGDEKEILLRCPNSGQLLTREAVVAYV